MSAFKHKKRKVDGSHRVDDWLMTYADMITLLLCFFAIFLSVSVPREDMMKLARDRVRERFANPDSSQEEIVITPVGEAPRSTSNLPGDKMSIGISPNLSSGMDATDNDASREQELSQQQERQQQWDQLEGGGTPQKEQKAGDRIIAIDMNSSAFFGSGQATLSVEGRNILKELKSRLNSAEYLDYIVTVEGHTDDAPIKTPQFPSNWELSTARAASVVRFLIEDGVSPQRLRAAGYADVFPKAPNRDNFGKAIPANQAQNRRVVIKLEKIEKDE